MACPERQHRAKEKKKPYGEVSGNEESREGGELPWTQATDILPARCERQRSWIVEQRLENR